MREVTADDLNAAADKLYKSAAPIDVVKHDDSGIFDTYTVLSGDRRYEVIGFGWFVLCECRDFVFAGGCCKHALLCMPKVCRICFKRDVRQRGAVCSGCEMDNSTYLGPPTIKKPVEKFGGVRI